MRCRWPVFFPRQRHLHCRSPVFWRGEGMSHLSRRVFNVFERDVCRCNHVICGQERDVQPGTSVFRIQERDVQPGTCVLRTFFPALLRPIDTLRASHRNIRPAGRSSRRAYYAPGRQSLLPIVRGLPADHDAGDDGRSRRARHHRHAAARGRWRSSSPPPKNPPIIPVAQGSFGVGARLRRCRSRPRTRLGRGTSLRPKGRDSCGLHRARWPAVKDLEVTICDPKIY